MDNTTVNAKGDGAPATCTPAQRRIAVSAMNPETEALCEIIKHAAPESDGDTEKEAFDHLVNPLGVDDMDMAKEEVAGALHSKTDSSSTCSLSSSGEDTSPPPVRRQQRRNSVERDTRVSTYSLPLRSSAPRHRSVAFERLPSLAASSPTTPSKAIRKAKREITRQSIRDLDKQGPPPLDIKQQLYQQWLTGSYPRGEAAADDSAAWQSNLQQASLQRVTERLKFLYRRLPKHHGQCERWVRNLRGNIRRLSKCQDLSEFLTTYDRMSRRSRTTRKMALKAIGDKATLDLLAKVARSPSPSAMMTRFLEDHADYLADNLCKITHDWPATPEERAGIEAMKHIDLDSGALRSLISGNACQFNSIQFTGMDGTTKTLTGTDKKDLSPSEQLQIIKDILIHIFNTGYGDRPACLFNDLAQQVCDAKEVFCSNVLRAISISAFFPARNIVFDCLGLDLAKYAIVYGKKECHPEIEVFPEGHFTTTIPKTLEIFHKVGVDRIPIASIACVWRLAWNEATDNISGKLTFTLTFSDSASKEEKTKLLEAWRLNSASRKNKAIQLTQAEQIQRFQERKKRRASTIFLSALGLIKD